MATLLDVHLVSLDGSTSTEPVDIGFVDTITTISPATGSSAADGDSIDGAGRYLVPGLIDTHVHLGSREALATAARAGITTVVDLGTHPDEVVDAQRTGPGVPAVLSAGSAPGSTQISRMGFPLESAVADPADAQRYLDWRVQHGSDLIKIILEDPAATDFPALDIATLAALVSGAHGRGLLTVAHVVTAVAFDRALDAGADVLTHAPLDRPLAGSTIQRMLELGTITSPTLVMMQVMAGMHGGDQAEGAFRNAVESVRDMHAAGVPIVVGTDANETPFAPVAHGASLHDEITLLRQAGLTTREALRAATNTAADAFRLGDRGRLEIGRRADLALVDHDPLVDPEVLRNPASVWVFGIRIVVRAAAGKASLYRRWRNIDLLVLAALARAEDRAETSEHPVGTRLVSTGDLRTELLTFLTDLAEGLTTPVGRALPPLLLERERRPELWNRVVELLVSPRQRLVTEALERAVARGEILPAAVTSTRVISGAALVLSQHFTSGPLERADVIAIVDEVVLPALRR